MSGRKTKINEIYNITVKGNKLYSIYTCLLVPTLTNTREAKTNKIPYKAYYYGEYIETFTAQRDFARKHNISESSLSRLVNGVYPSHKGWVIEKEQKRRIN